MHRYLSVSICTIAAIAFGIWVTYEHNWQFGAAHIIGLVVLIVGVAAAWANATRRGAVDDASLSCSF